MNTDVINGRPEDSGRTAVAPPEPCHGRWSLLWSRDGHAVAALLDDQPIAFIVAGQSRAYARYVKPGANPWAIP